MAHATTASAHGVPPDPAPPFAVVTGGSRGIGLAIARTLRTAGHPVGIIGRDPHRGQREAGQLDASFAAADVTDPDALQAALDALRDAAGQPIGILVNNAGTARTAPFHKTTPELLRAQFELNVVAAASATRAVLDGMRTAGFGRIVNIASTAALKGYAYTAAYCASKHALLGLTRALALETVGSGITANAVCPGYVRTDMLEGSAQAVADKTGGAVDDVLATMAAANPAGRFVEAHEVADTVRWLVGRDASAITGQAIAVAFGEIG